MKKVAAYILILAALFCTVPVGFKIFRPDLVPLKFAVICHIISAFIFASALFLLTGKKIGRTKRSNIWWIYAFVLCLIIPLYGVISALTVYIIQGMKRRLPRPIVKEDVTVQEPEVFRETKTRSRQLEILDRLDIEPFVDIFRRGQADLKKSAVKLLGTIQSQKAVSTLMMALMDEDIEIRLFAAGILGRIEDEYAKEIKVRSAKFAAHPKDHAKGLDLVKFYFAYAGSGLLDAISRTYYYNEALKVLNKLTEDGETLMAKAYAEYMLGDYDKAKNDIVNCLKTRGEDPKSNELYWEILFSSRDYTELAKNIEEAKKRSLKGIDEEIVKFWTVE